MRISLTLLGLIGMLLFSGCSNDDTETADSTNGEIAQGTPQAPEATPAPPADSDDAEAGTTTDESQTDTPEPTTDDTAPGGSQETADTGGGQDEMPDPAAEAEAAAKKAAEDAKNYPHNELVAAPGNPRLTRAYQACEDQLRDSPEDTMQLMQRAYLLFSAGGLMMESDRDNALRAFRVAYEHAQQLVKDNPDLPAPYQKVLANIYYNGACGESLDGKADVARATLQKAIEFGWGDMDQLKENPDLANVRALPGFEAELDGWIEAAREAAMEMAREELSKGETFPFDFTVTDISGAELKLADLKGKVVIVDIWGTWCPPCRAEIPSFIKLQEQFGEKGLQMVGLNYEHAPDEEGKAKLVQDFVEANGINYPCALGTDELRAQVPAFQGYPTTLFLDRTGTVRLKAVGLHEYSYLESLVETLLAEEVGEAAAENTETAGGSESEASGTRGQ